MNENEERRGRFLFIGVETSYLMLYKVKLNTKGSRVQSRDIKLDLWKIGLGMMLSTFILISIYYLKQPPRLASSTTFYTITCW